jgi:hypothetical protein
MAGKKDVMKGGKPITKTGFIKSFADSVPADEIVAKAKDAGLDLTKKFVWTIQSEMRSGTGKKSKKKAVRKGSGMTAKATVGRTVPSAQKTANRKFGPSAATSASSNGSRTTAEQRLTALVIELGTTRADEVYKSVRAKLNNLVG